MSITTLLPLLRNEALSVATENHSMNKVRDTIVYFNPVITADQVIYRLIKQVQWYWPDLCGEDKFVVMSEGPPHLKSLGNILQSCEWTGDPVSSGVASSGIAESFLYALSVIRTRHTHQVTASCLCMLQNETYEHH